MKTSVADRKAHPDLFLRGDYLPLDASGAAVEHVVAYARRYQHRESIVAVPRLIVGLIGARPLAPIGAEVWGEPRLILADVELETRYRDLFTGATITATTTGDSTFLALADGFAVLPLALLEGIG